MNSAHDRILCKISPQIIRLSLSCPEDLVTSLVYFTEANVLQVYEQATSEIKNNLYQHILSTPVSHEILVIPFQSDLCIPIVRSSITLLSQILGSYDDSQVTKVIIGFLIYIRVSLALKLLNLMSF